MSKSPYLNAVLASLYIVVVVFVMNTLQNLFPHDKSIIIPMFMLSLFVLSAATMGFLFLYQPFRLYFDNHKHEALLFFTKTLMTFACFVVLFLILLIGTH